MSSSEYLNYESGKFSKSAGIGVFGTDVMETGIPADVWRFYIFWNRPETSDFTFTWADFLEKVNGELIGNLGNLANRTLTFVSRYYDGLIPAGKPDEAFWQKAREIEERVSAHLERADLRDAFRAIFELSDLANKRFQDGEPWKKRTTDPESAASLLSDLCYVLRDLAILIHPYMPHAAEKLASLLGKTIGHGGLDWSSLGTFEGLSEVKAPEVLFAKLDDNYIAELRERYSGSQKDRADRAKSEQPTAPASASAPAPAKPAPAPASVAPKPMLFPELSTQQRFLKLIALKVARIVKIERHPKADKLYIETLDDGSGTERIIVSGLVPFYREEELLGRNIILVDNLKPAKLRGVESKGMLLAASLSGPEGKEAVEVLSAPWANPGTCVTLEGLAGDSPAGEGSTAEGSAAEGSAKAEIDVDTFFSVPLVSRDGFAMVGTARLQVEGKALQLQTVRDGEIG